MPTGSATRSTTSRTRSSRNATARDARAAVRAQARAHRGPPRGVSPTREVFNQLTNRDIDAHRSRRDRLLPRRLRPRHPADRRARQLPRARVVDARRLPDPGQQQPVGDHEAPDRRHGHPRRHRRGRRHLRDERGGHGARAAARRGGFWLVTAVTVALAAWRPSSCAGSAGSASSPAAAAQPQTTGRAFGWAAAWSAGRASIGFGDDLGLADGVPFGPSRRLQPQLLGLGARAASSRPSCTAGRGGPR